MSSCIHSAGACTTYVCKCKARAAKPAAQIVPSGVGHKFSTYYCYRSGDGNPILAMLPTGRRLRAAASTSSSLPSPPPQPPQQQPAPRASSATASGPVAMATAAQILEAIPRARTVQELRVVLQQARAQGCLTTAHSLAVIMQLGSLAAATPTPGGAEEARQLGAQLASGLRGHITSLPPALRTPTERALEQLGLGAELEEGAAAVGSQPGRGSGDLSQAGGSGLPVAPAQPPRAAGGGGRGGMTAGGGVGRAGLGSARVGGRGRGSGTGPRDTRPVEASGTPAPPPPQLEKQQQQQQPQGQQVKQQRQLQQPGQQQGQRRPWQQQQHQQQQWQPRRGPQVRQPQEVVAESSVGSASQAAAPLVATAPPTLTAALSSPGQGPAPGPAPTASSPPPPGEQQPASTSPLQASPPEPGALRSQGAVTRNGGDDATAAATGGGAPPAAAAAAEEQAFQEALLSGWAIWSDMERSRARGAASAAGGRDPELLQVQRGTLEEALQRRPLDQLTVGDLAEVVHLMATLRLMPRYEWLCGVQARLRGEMAAVEAAMVSGGGWPGTEAAAATFGDASGVLEDLRQVYDATEELTQMCWEADGRAAAVQNVAEPDLAAGMGVGESNGVAKATTQIGDLSSGGGGGAGRQAHVSRQSGEDAATAARTAVQGSAAEEAADVTAVAVAEPAAVATAVAEAAAAAVASAVATAAAGSDAALPSRAEAGTPLPAAGADADAALALEAQPSAASLPQPLESSGAGSEGLELEPARPSSQPLESSSNSEAAVAAAPGDTQEPPPPADDDPVAALARLEALLRQARGTTAALSGSGSGDAATSAAAEQVGIAELASLLVEALQGEAAASRPALLAPAGAAADPNPGLAAPQVGALVAAARAAAAPAPLPAPLLMAAVRLLVASRGGVSVDDVAPVLGACVAADYTPSSYLLAQLASLAFPAQTGLAAALDGQQERQRAHRGSGAPSAAFVRSLHECGTALGRLGCRLNSRQFGEWVGAVARAPLALAPPQLAALLAACTERGFVVRPAGAAAALVAAAAQPPARLQRLSAAEAAAVAHFAAQQGLQLGGGASANGDADGGVAAALLQHLAPRLRELGSKELASLQTALRAAGALPGGGNAALVSAWLGAHSAALLPHAEVLAPDAALSLLRCCDQLHYRPPTLLLLGISLALESHFAAAPLLPLLQALHLLLCRLSFAPNEGLATAIQERLVPRLMLAAAAEAPGPLPLQAAAVATSAAQPSPQGLCLTLRQRLAALDVLAAARVRPHPAQLAALLEVELAGGEGRMAAALGGDELVRLLWRCAEFRALPSWRFIGEWLEAFAGAIGAGASTTAAVSPGALARAGWCLAQMGVQPEAGWLAAYQAALAPALARLDAEELSLVAHSALLLRSRPSVEWLEALLRTALGRMEQGMDAASAARLLHFASTAEVEVSKDWMQSFFLHTLGLVAGPALQSAATKAAAEGAAASPDQVVLMLRSLARLGFRPPEAWLAAALERLRVGAAALSPACYPVALMSLVRLCPDLVAAPRSIQMAPGGVVDELARAAYRRRAQFSTLELAWLLEALRCCPDYELPPAAAAGLMAALQQREALEEAETEAGTDVAGALGDAVSAEWLRWGGWLVGQEEGEEA